VLALVISALSVVTIAAPHEPELSVMPAPAPQKLLIPAYFYPGPLWDQVIAGAPTVGAVVMNPDSGPGQAQNPDYVAAVDKAQTAGIQVIGYVHTSYGARDPRAVKDEIERFKAWYHVDGIFLDQVADGLASLAYYQNLADYIRGTPGYVVVLNHSTVPDETYTAVGDILVIFEGDYRTYVSFQPPSWVYRYPPTKFAHFVHGTRDSSALTHAMALDNQRNVTHVYVTDDLMPNPWDTLPRYWTSELSELGSSS
jgi:hypothetical protein